MGSATIDVVPYDGALLSASLFTGTETLVLGDFGPTESGEIIDADGILGPGDDGISTFNSEPITFVGSGTATPGVDVAGLIVPLGTSVEVIIFATNEGTPEEQVYFFYPDGPPNLIGALAVVIDVDSDPATIFAPACFVKGTQIATPLGNSAVEDIAAGDWVRDIHGQDHEVVWTGHQTFALDRLGPRAKRKLAPVKIKAGAFGPGFPVEDTWLSQQHQVLVQSCHANLLFGYPEVLVPAKALHGFRGEVDTTGRSVSYHHILCADHAILSANGLPAESLFLGRQSRRTLTQTQKAAISEVSALRLPDLRAMERAAPTASYRHSKLLLSEMDKNAA